MPLDETLQRRVQRAKAARESVVVEMAGLRRRQLLPVERILPSQVQAFSKVVGAKLRDKSSTFARDYLHAVVDQVVVKDDTATISGSHARLMHAVAQKKMGTDQVPTSIHAWRAPERFELPTPWFVGRIDELLGLADRATERLTVRFGMHAP